MSDRAAHCSLWLAIAFSLAPIGATEARQKNRAEWLRRSVVVLPAPGDELNAGTREALHQALVGTDLVLLGEATRGDGTTFLAKTQLVRYLSNDLGFDVLAFECGLFDCHRAWEAIQKGQLARDALGDALFPLYVDSQQFQPLLELIDQCARGDHPLEIAGIDSQLGSTSVEALFAGLETILADCGADPASVEGFELLRQVIHHVADGGYSSGQLELPDNETRRRVDRALNRISESLICPEPAIPNVEPIELEFWQQVVVNLRSIVELTWELGRWDPQQTMDPLIHNQRDRQMTENVLWLRRHLYPNRKMIIWSLSLHLARDLDRLETGDVETRNRFARFDLLGQRLASDLEPDPYVVVFSAFEGNKGSIYQAPHALLSPTQGSLEDLMGHTGLDYAFLDLRRLGTLDGGSWLRRPLIARPIAFKELRGVWSRHVDAFVFIRTMQAATRAH